MVWVLAAFLIGAVITPPLIGWLVTSFVELTGGERQNRPSVTQQELLKLRGASDAQSEIEMRSIYGRLMERTKAEYDKYLAGEQRKAASHKSPGYFKWRPITAPLEPESSKDGKRSPLRILSPSPNSMS